MRLSVASLRRVIKGDLTIQFVPQALTSYGGLERREITMPAGDRATAILMRATEFVPLAAARVGRFAVPESVAAG